MSSILDEYLTEDELVKALRLKSRRTVQRWRADREGPDWTPIGRRIFYSKQSVRRWLEQREHRMVRARMRGVPK